MKHLFSKGIIALALCVLTWTGATAQPISMGSNPINFGSSCYSSYIRNATTTSWLAFGINQYCFGPAYSWDEIVMDLFNIRMGIGVLNPSYQLQLASNSAAKPGSSSWTVASDQRLKQDVKGFTDGLSMVRGIRPVTYHYNKASGYDPNPEYVGVLAQELREVAPYMVHETQLTTPEGKSGDYLAVDFGAMDFVLVNAVKELDAELQTQLVKNEVLESSLADLRAEVEALKALLGKTTSLAQPSLTVSPNPASAETRISCTLPDHVQTAEIQVIALDGKLYPPFSVKAGTTTVTFQTESIPAGTYILKLVADGKPTASTRLVIQH
jgi:trimeric autotransporter adhesin